MTVVDNTAVQALVARAQRDIDDGSLPACQLAVAYGGELLVDETFGAASDSRFCAFSVTKALSAALGWLLMSDGVLADTTRVADVVPEFAENGKSDVTLEHLLTHTAGFPRAPMRPEQGADRAQRVARMASWRLDWQPGTQTAYHATSAYWALVEMVDRLSGTDFRQLFTTRIADPLGLTSLRLGVPPEDAANVQEIAVVGNVDEGSRTLGSDVSEAGSEFLLRYNDPVVRAAGVPGAGGVGRAADIALFYQALLHNTGDIWNSDVLADVTLNVRNTLTDAMLGVPANRTLGLVVAGDDGNAVLRGLASKPGPRTFGAPGVGGQVAFADPDSGVSVSYVTNGIERDVVRSFRRAARISDLAVACVQH